MTSSFMIGDREARRACRINRMAGEFWNLIAIVKIMKEAAGP
jgi:hypothetical protein